MPSCLPASLADNKGSRHSEGVVVQGLKKRSAEGHGGVSRLLLRRLSHSRRQKKKSPSTRFLRGRLALDSGRVCFDASSDQGNVVLSSTIGCNAFLLIPAGSGPVEAETEWRGFVL